MTKQNITEALKRLGYETFQPGQEQAINALANGKDVFAIMPTGGGKSLIYQVAAELINGLVLVISPLIALMKDQVEAAKQQGQKAAVINSQLSEGELRAAMNGAFNVTGITDTNEDKRPIKNMYRDGDKVTHSTWGNGVVQRIEDTAMMVLFESVGHKILDLQLVNEEKLLS